MPFARTTPLLPSGADLDQAMRSIGLRVGRGEPHKGMSSDIELVLAAVACEALPKDYRLLGVLAAWLELHHARVNVPRLGRILRHASSDVLVLAWWGAVGHWLAKEDIRWRALERLYEGPRLDLDDPEITALQVELGGEDPRFAGGPLRVHAKLLRSRASDVEQPHELATHHPLYLRRVQFGPSYRADVWAALDAEPHATPAQIARRVGCAYETARVVAMDWHVAQQATRNLRRSA